MSELVHKEKWTVEELEIVYKNYTKKTIKQIADMLPSRSFAAVKNKVKLIKFGKPTVTPFNARRKPHKDNNTRGIKC